MPLETVTYIDDLVATNPANSDGLAQADDHIRNIKAALLATFPGITGPLEATNAQLDAVAVDGLFQNLASGTSGAPSVAFSAEPALGLYRAAAATMGLAGGLTVTGRILGNGAHEAGEIVSFPKAPASLGTGGTATSPLTTYKWLEMDGGVYNVADFPALGAFLGSTFGGNGTTTFGVPNVKDTGRFLRSRTASVTVGTSQSNQNKAHTHTGAITNAAGSHNHGGVTGSPNVATFNGPTNAWIGQGVTSLNTGGDSTTGHSPLAASSFIWTHSHTHSITTDGDHSHTVTIPTTDSGGTEARPEALVVVMCIKT